MTTRQAALTAASLVALALSPGCAPSTPPAPLTPEEQAKADARAEEVRQNILIQSAAQQAIPSSPPAVPPGAIR